MKTTLFVCRWLLALMMLFAPGVLRAQSYAPETHFHDTVQRHFVVELARVLAWRENQKGGRVAEVTYALECGADGTSKWDVKWLDASGRTVGQVAVSYLAASLVTGPAFYREVFRQMTMGGMQISPTLTSQQVMEAYWKGAELAGYSRVAGLRAAFDLAPVKPKTAESDYAPKLAGLLPHASLPVLSGGYTMDPVVLARGAAWLAVSEAMAKDRSMQAGAGLDALWAPILFLAGRENAAGALWKSAAVKPGAMAACWDYLFTRPKTPDAFVFFAKAENRRFMMPVMNAYCRRAENPVDFEKMLPPVFDGPANMASLLYDHFPCIMRYATVSTGHMFSEGAPFAWQDWIDCLRKFEPTALDFTGYKSALASQQGGIAAYAPVAGKLANETCLRGFDTVAPLVELGHKEGTGKLIPVAAVTARDLLNYGWEMTGAQLGSRYHFVAEKWGVPELAGAIASEVKSKVSGLDLFFMTDAEMQRAPEPPEADRLEDVDSMRTYIGSNRAWWKRMVGRFEDYGSRHWLQAGWVRGQCSVFYHADEMDMILPHIERVRAEGGALCDGFIRQWFADDLRDDGVPRVPGALEYKRKMAEEGRKTEIDQDVIGMVWSDYYEKLPALDRARELERAYWQGAANGYLDRLVDAYIEAHAYVSAIRFCREAKPRVDAVTYSAWLGPRQYTLAMLEGDKATMQEALLASQSGSSEDMRLHLEDAAVKGDAKAMDAMIGDWGRRYGGDNSLALLKGFLPLIPALKDAASPDHGKALDWFATSPDWITYQWIFSQNAKLGTEESIRFFGGETTDWVRQFVVLALRKDKGEFEKEYQEHERTWRAKHRDWKATVLIHYLRNELMEIPVPAEQPDLKSADAMTLTERVLASVGK
ncbi:MAG: hypothetical protein WCD79_10555 [Chthoniobacteraceae bacterium]